MNHDIGYYRIFVGDLVQPTSELGGNLAPAQLSRLEMPTGGPVLSKEWTALLQSLLSSSVTLGDASKGLMGISP